MYHLYDSNAIRELDSLAIARDGSSGLGLMSEAGLACLRELKDRWPQCQRLTVVCGQGNNAGDGYVLAREARATGMDVTVIQVGGRERLSADALLCYEKLLAAQIEPQVHFDAISSADVIVDALFGIGLNRAIEGPFRSAVEHINRASAPVLSIDIPSGLEASTGTSLGCTVKATLTVTFLGLKQGLYTADGPACAGEVVLDELGIDSTLLTKVSATARLIGQSYIKNNIRRRKRTAHKGDHGHVLLVGGAPGYVGAIRLAGEAAARSGSGLVSVAAHPEVANYINLGRPELMVHAIRNADELAGLLHKADCVAIGPGLGRSQWAMDLFARVLATTLPLVVDADALNLLADEPFQRANWVLTPHPGEASRLLGVTTQQIHADRFSAAAQLVNKFGGCVVLKGAGSIVMGSGVPDVLSDGNPGMGSGGMGDVLTGIIAAFIGQGYSVLDAARLGACVHAAAGDHAARDGERGMLASDLLAHIRTLVN
ncbi:MAG: NAD(P)H-hydrate dehydratase [Proteobacteria bacterium]|nr:NAD(P)H-hydrate dehydratase [Pseudomonadota bacterium]